MRLLVRMPNWLGDAVMATPALANLVRHFREPEVVVVGSPSVAEMFRSDCRFHAVLGDDSKSWRLRPLGIRRLARTIQRSFGPFDLAFAFPNSVSSALLLRMAGCRLRVGAERGWANMLLTHPVPIESGGHQAEKYNDVVNGFLGTHYETGPTWLHVANPHLFPRPTVGINPGATFGSAKRWNPERFAQVAAALSQQYDIAVFGSTQETHLAAQIEASLRRQGIENVENFAGKTSLEQLASRIAGLDLFITNDSGPMHIAGALAVPTVAIFGPTNPAQTSPWRHDRCAIVRHEVPCAPCMQRTCPLKHHACMENIQAEEVLAAAQKVEG